MKKITVLLLAWVLLISISGCSKPSIDQTEAPAITGTYEMQVDLTDLVIESFDKGMGIQDSDLSLGNFLSPFTLTLVYDFHKDGSYRISVNNDSIAESLKQLASAAVPLMDDVILQQYREAFVPFGFTVERHEDLSRILGMTRDEVFQTATGKSREEFIAQLIDDSFSNVLTTPHIAEGRYKAERGRLYLSNSLDEEVSKNSYEVYHLTEDCIFITKAVNVSSADFFSYPYILTKIEPKA